MSKLAINGDLVTDETYTVSLAKKTSRKWSNSVDSVAFSHPISTLYATVGYSEEANGGCLFCLDYANSVPGNKTIKFTATHGITCMDISTGIILAIGTGEVLDNVLGTGDAFILDLRTNTTRHPATTINTSQSDMDSIRFSPCSNYLAISDALDNSVTVHDLRLPGKTLLSYNHSVTGQSDCMMALTWLSNGRLVSGGMDGLVRLLDLSYAPFVNNATQQVINIGHQINTIATLPADDTMMLVGTDSGIVSCYSINPSVGSYTYRSCY